MTFCPHGHQTASTDYCDVCGSPVDAAAPTPGIAPQASTAPQTRDCPNCGAVNSLDTLFCETCGFDFTTGAKPRVTSAGSLLDLDAPAPAPSIDAAEPTDSSAGVGPVELVDIAPATQPPADGGVPADVSREVFAPTPAQPEPAPVAPPPAAEATDLAESTTLPSAVQTRDGAPGGAWTTVAEVWVDPDWYRAQEAADPMPSPGLPTVVPLRRSRTLIGRTSRSRGIEPEIDCGLDSSVSRRQAELSTDGRRWWVEDLGSANGTYVGAPAQALPATPIAQRTELNPGDRIYVGAWTRIVLREATPDERASYDA